MIPITSTQGDQTMAHFNHGIKNIAGANEVAEMLSNEIAKISEKEEIVNFNFNGKIFEFCDFITSFGGGTNEEFLDSLDEILFSNHGLVMAINRETFQIRLLPLFTDLVLKFRDVADSSGLLDDINNEENPEKKEKKQLFASFILGCVAASIIQESRWKTGLRDESFLEKMKAKIAEDEKLKSMVALCLEAFKTQITTEFASEITGKRDKE